MNFTQILGFAVGPIAGALIGLVTVPVIAWGFSPEDIGRLNVLQVTLSFSLLLLTLGLDQAYVREYHGSANQPALLKTCFSPGFFALLVFAVVTYFQARELAFWLYGVNQPLLYEITLVCILLIYITRYLSLILRMQERGLDFSMIQLTPKIINLLIVSVSIAYGMWLKFYLLASSVLVSMLIMLLVYLWRTRKHWLPAINEKHNTDLTIKLIKFGMPLTFSGVAYWGLTATSTVVLRSQSSLGELGIYSVTSSFAGVAIIFQSIFTVVWAPTVYKWISQGDNLESIDLITHRMLSAVCGIFVLVGAFSWLTDHLLPPHYDSVKYLLVGAITPPLLYTLSEVTGVGIGISRRTLHTVWITLASLISNILLSLWLIPNMGAAGAVTANAIAYVLFFIGRTEASIHVWRKVYRSKLYIYVGILVTCAILTVVIGSKSPIHYALVWMALAIIIGFNFRVDYKEMYNDLRLALYNRRFERKAGY